MTRVRITAALLTLVLAGSARAQAPAAPSLVQPVKSQAVQDAERKLWSPGEARYMRLWQVTGFSEPPKDEAKLVPGGAWRPLVAWDDLVDLTGAGVEGRYLYASATVTRELEGPAELSLGAGGVLAAWVNGEPLTISAGPTGLYDAIRLPIRLKAGDNRILLRAGRGSGATLLTARVLSPGQPLADVRLEPGVWDQDGQLNVRTDARPGAGVAEVVVTAPGGKVMARTNVARGATASLPIADWPSGPYDVAVSTTAADGQPLRAFSPWYKGDMTAAAHALVTRAANQTTLDAQASHWRMLSALIVDRAGADLSRIKDAYGAVHSALMEAAELDLGPQAAARPSGFIRLAWIDPADGSTQFCRAYLPTAYDPKLPWPTVVTLHGSNPGSPPYIRYWSIDVRHHSAPESWPVILIEPHGRGNSGYVGPGEQDVLHCLQAARARLNIDERRTYLTGGSMGGMGAWRVGARNASLFAAIAPVFGAMDMRLDARSGRDDPAADRPMERWLREIQSDFVSAEQLNNTPVFVHHGDQDAAVDVRGSRHAVGMLQRWGYEVRYREHPGRGHESLGEMGETISWFLERRRPEAPPKVRVRAPDLRAAHAFWLTVDGALESLTMIEADAEMIEPGLLRLDTRNVARLTLAPPPALLASDALLRVVWNGRTIAATASRDGRFVLVAPGAPTGARLKTAALPGGVFDVLSTPFVIVVGTTAKNPEMRDTVRSKAASLAGLWKAIYGDEPRVIEDRALTTEQEASLSLILIGGADANLIAARLRRDIPLALTPDAITVDGHRMAARDAYAVVLRPNPWAADRYVMAVAGNSAEGLFHWDPFALVAATGDAIGNPYDWWIGDGRRPPFAKGRSPDRGWVVAGVFDQTWRRDDRWTFVGDAALRAAAPLATRPKAAVTLSLGVLDRYVGRYTMVGAPQATLVVRRQGDDLLIDPPGGQAADRLLPQSPTEFRLATSGQLVTLALDSSGKVVEAQFGEGAAASRWRPAQ